jgi:2-iminobutanoate/2-iminopropanoate deaminase
MLQHLLALILLAVVAATIEAAQTLQRHDPPELAKPGSFTHVVRAGNLVFISGQVGTLPDRSPAGTTMTAQVEQAIKNLRVAVASQGLTLNHIAKTTIFTTSIAELRAVPVDTLRTLHPNGVFPASTLVQVQQLADPAYKVEIEAIAVVP